MKSVINLIAIFFLTSPLYSQTLLDYQQIKSIEHPDQITEQTENSFEMSISPPFSETIKSVILSKDEKLLAAQYGDNGLVIYETKNFEAKLKSIDIEKSPYLISRFSDDNMYLFKKIKIECENCDDNTYLRINTISGNTSQFRGNHNGYVKPMKQTNGVANLFTSDSSRFYLTGPRGTILVYEKISNANQNLEFDNTNLTSDIDTNIPVNTNKRSNVYALVIGNEDYSSKQATLKKEQNADYAANDAEIFYQYFTKTLCVPERQTFKLINATSAEMNQAIFKLISLAEAEDGNAELFFYYSGHGLPDPINEESYLIPVDVNGSDLTQAIKLSTIYSKLSAVKCKKITILLDACFSGGARNKELLSLKGVKIKPKQNNISGNIVIFSSSSNEESSNIYKEKKHGYFTYFILKKTKETKGEINYSELFNWTLKNVKKETILINNIQTPNIQVSSEVGEDWKTWTLK